MKKYEKYVDIVILWYYNIDNKTKGRYHKMTNLLKEIEKVKSILSMNWTNEDEKQVWVDKLHDLENKIETSKNNEDFYKAYAVYDR